MTDDRATRVWASITACAQREWASVSLRHVCLACAEAVQVDGVGLSMQGRVSGLRESVVATDQRSEEMEELQATLGDGPGVEVLGGNAALLAADLSSADALARWPIFAPAAVERGVLAMYSFPIRAGAAHLGVLDLYRERVSELRDNEFADALRYADAALSVSLDIRGGVVRQEAAPNDLLTERRAAVHQASGMVSVQLGINIVDALARLRAYAFAYDRRLGDVATDVVERRLRFTLDGDNQDNLRDTGPDLSGDGSGTGKDGEP